MRRPIAGILLCLLALAPAACGTSTPTAPTTPATTTDTFTGTVNQAGAVTNTFTTVASGTVTATLTAVGPDNTKAMGFAMGTYNTLLNVCQIVLANDLALQGAILQASATSQGTYCVRAYDTGTIAADTPFTFTITVVHP